MSKRATKITGWCEKHIVGMAWTAVAYNVLIVLLLVATTACAAPGTPTPTPGTPAPSQSSVAPLNPTHVRICHMFKAKAEDDTRAQKVRLAALREWSGPRCEDVRAAEANA